MFTYLYIQKKSKTIEFMISTFIIVFYLRFRVSANHISDCIRSLICIAFCIYNDWYSTYWLQDLTTRLAMFSVIYYQS